MARSRFTTRFTLRLSPSLRNDLRCEAAAKGDDFADLIRAILAEHVTRRATEGWQQAESWRRDDRGQESGELRRNECGMRALPNERWRQFDADVAL